MRVLLFSVSSQSVVLHFFKDEFSLLSLNCLVVRENLIGHQCGHSEKMILVHLKKKNCQYSFLCFTELLFTG